MKSSEELEKAARHKGRAYECLHCSRQGNKAVVDVKSRVEEHILKYHLGLDQAPFYCTLCLFRSTEKKPLLQHVNHHSRHRSEALKKNIIDSAPYLKESQHPYKMCTDQDYRQFGQEESLQFFLKRSQETQANKSKDDLLGRAFQVVFPDGLGVDELDQLEANTRDSQPQPRSVDPNASLTSLVASIIANLQKDPNALQPPLAIESPRPEMRISPLSPLCRESDHCHRPLFHIHHHHYNHPGIPAKPMRGHYQLQHLHYQNYQPSHLVDKQLLQNLFVLICQGQSPHGSQLYCRLLLAPSSLNTQPLLQVACLSHCYNVTQQSLPFQHQLPLLVLCPTSQAFSSPGRPLNISSPTRQPSHQEHVPLKLRQQK